MTNVSRDALVAFAARIEREGMTPLGGPHAYDEDRAAGYRAAAVLALFAPSDDGVYLFLVQRSPDLRDHPGQISLPGGRLEAGESQVQAAVRETHEEIGLAPRYIEVLTVLAPVLVPISRFVVHPILGWTDSPDAVTAVAGGEVLHTLRVPVTHLLDPARRASVHIAGMSSAGFELSCGWVWGFTGNFLDHLFTQLGWTRPWPRERVHEMTMAHARGEYLRAETQGC